ncbi:hypothetical protein D3C72_1557060 [compost metagenome]
MIHPACFYLKLCSVWHFHDKTAVQNAMLHIQSALKRFDRNFVQIQHLPIDQNMQAYPIDGIDDLGEIFRIPIFPPAYACFVRIINTGQIRPLQGFPAEFFFKISPLPHPTITNSEDTFRKFIMFGAKCIFDNLPRVMFDICFHLFIFFTACSESKANK